MSKSERTKFRTPYDVVHEPCDYVDNSKEVRTEQSHRDACDVNKLVARYEKTGVLPQVADRKCWYGDFSNVKDYQVALNQLNNAQILFDNLSVKVRNRFDNDVSKLLSFLDKKSNLAEAIELGIIAKPVESGVSTGGSDGKSPPDASPAPSGGSK